MNQSSWKGISIRGWLALIIVALSFIYFFAVTLLVLLLEVNETALQVILLILGLMGTSIGGATGFYFGQKTAEPPAPEIPELPELPEIPEFPEA